MNCVSLERSPCTRVVDQINNHASQRQGSCQITLGLQSNNEKKSLATRNKQKNMEIVVVSPMCLKMREGIKKCIYNSWRFKHFDNKSPLLFHFSSLKIDKFRWFKVQGKFKTS